MTKKRIAVVALSSPVILGLGIGILLASIVIYAIDGKWEFKKRVNELREG